MALREIRFGDRLAADDAVGDKQKKTVEQTYKKLSQLEHILLRPDTYIGSAECVTQSITVWDSISSRMVVRDVTFPPGLYKIFDEILVNAADHKQRCPEMKSIRVEIDPENNLISVWNDGKGIPIEMHEKEGVYVPELIFGHLLTSSNYDDNEKKVVGGRNGYGAKLANIFSCEFVVETADSERGRKYKQVFKNNMSVIGKPSVTNGSKKDSWTKITFYPDLAKFGMTYLNDDITAVMKKRVYDIAGTNPSLKVFVNGERIPVKSFKDYISLYTDQNIEIPFMHDRSGDRWEVAVGASQGQLEQVSFVNCIWTIKGGTHVIHVVDQIVTKISDHISKKNKGMKLKPHQIKSHLSVFVNCLVENPAFDSQTKETLTTRPSQFGSKFVLSEEFFKKILKSGIVENILAFAKFKQSRELTKTDGGKKARVLGIPKLDDANKAGGREASKCTLILTEGDSAKAFAISGLSIIGRDYYGVFPLRGKLLNVREATHKQIMENAEILNLKKILGLQHGKTYTSENLNTLRYGHVLVMTDQDHDGSHIKGLLINFFDHFWPTLLKIDGFLQEFITPIVKCVKGNTEKVFFTIPEYRSWVESAGAGWKSKYYKGLGTSTAAEAKAYFSNLCLHLLPFCWKGTTDSEMIDLAFAKSKVNERKEWLTRHVPGTFFNHTEDELNYTNFINKELILFSIADNARSIPNIVDGLKPSQRKVLFACFKRKLKSEVKVAQLAGYVSEHAAYHHGEASLQSTILGLAQNFVGSNNCNLLVPAGQFGTRLQGGKDAASSRYIFTRLAPVARALFPEQDDPLLKYLEDDGLDIEPEWYCPVIPTVLVNGAEGIGTGWSSQIPCYNPRDLIECVRRMLRGQDAPELVPWYRGFTGTVVPVENSKTFDIHGVAYREDPDEIIVRELPVRSWTTPYKEFLESQIAGNPDAGKSAMIREYRDQSTEDKVYFAVSLTPDGIKEMEASGVYKKLKLTSSVSTGNMMLFDSFGRIAKYHDTTAIMKEFFAVRLSFYTKRRSHILSQLQDELETLDNKQRFILMVIDDELTIAKRKKNEIVQDLKKHKFTAKPKASEADDDGGYDYLLSMPICSLTMERVEALCKQRNEKEEEKKAMERTTETDLWTKDLDNLLAVLEKDEADAAKDAEDLEKKARRTKLFQKGSRGNVKSKAKTVLAADDDSDCSRQMLIKPPSPRAERIRVPRKEKASSKASLTSKSNRASKTNLASTAIPETDEEQNQTDAVDLSKEAMDLVQPNRNGSSSDEPSDDESSDDESSLLTLTERLAIHRREEQSQRVTTDSLFVTEKATKEQQTRVVSPASKRRRIKSPAAKKKVVTVNHRAAEKVIPTKKMATTSSLTSRATRPRRGAARKVIIVESSSEEGDDIICCDDDSSDYEGNSSDDSDF